MITGTISHRRAYINLTVRGPGGQEGDVEFLLDTGFNGVITLPRAACTLLALPYSRPQPIGVADGSRVLLDVYDATLLWDGRPRAVEVLAKDGTALIGMALLDGSDVRLQVTDGGLITIEPLQPATSPP
jgi:clan AA aspartic protease